MLGRASHDTVMAAVKAVYGVPRQSAAGVMVTSVSVCLPVCLRLYLLLRCAALLDCYCMLLDNVCACCVPCILPRLI